MQKFTNSFRKIKIKFSHLVMLQALWKRNINRPWFYEMRFFLIFESHKTKTNSGFTKISSMRELVESRVTVNYTAWKVSKYRVFSGPYFLTFGQNTERYSVSLRIQSECEKIRTIKNSGIGHFSRSVRILYEKEYFTRN